MAIGHQRIGKAIVLLDDAEIVLLNHIVEQTLFDSVEVN